MFKVSIIIPTHNRPELLKRSLRSILAQTYKDFEIIVVDDGLEQRADGVIKDLNDPRVKYIQHDKERGGGVARNTGIKSSSGEFIAFQDDDDEWLPEKLFIQMDKFGRSSLDVGFCFTAVTNIFDDHKEDTSVPDGVADYLELALGNFKGFLNVTLLIKKHVLEDIGLFDESLPSHQEVDLVIRISKKYKGLGINQPLVRVDMSAHDSVGQNLNKRIMGREMILKKYFADFKKDHYLLALNYYWLALLYRDSGQFNKAEDLFKKAFKIKPRFLYFKHCLSLYFGPIIYSLIKKLWQ